MATSITTNADLLEYGLITDNEIERLSTARMKAESWATLHKRGWSKVLDKLALLPSPIEESDLDDTDQLKPATCYFVLYYAYEQASFMGEQNQDRAEWYWKKGEKELAELRPSAFGGTVDRSAYNFRRARRM